MNGIPHSRNSLAFWIMPSRPSGATMPKVMPGTSFTWFSCERIIAPGWKAVIWLLSWSVVMNACGVNSSSITLTCDRSMPCSMKCSRYGAKSWPTVAIGTGEPPSSFRL